MAHKNHTKQAHQASPDQGEHMAVVAAVQQKSVDVDAVATVASKPQQMFSKEKIMDQNTLFSQMQQYGLEWVKMMTEATSRVTAELAQAQKLEKQAFTRAASAIDEASRVAKSALNTCETLTTEWHKAVNEYTQRALDLVTPKN